MDYPLRLVSQLRAHLQALRKQRGITQAQLGRRLGLSQVRIAEIEANPGVVSIEQLALILSALGATFVLRDVAPDAAPEPQSATQPTAASNRRPRRAPAKGGPTPSPSAKKPVDAPKTMPNTVAATVKPKKGSW
jgi:HTH-type transcriptional regulator/antitoxin HipB